MDIKNIESQSEYVENLSSNLNSLNIYMKALNHIPLLSPDEEKDLFIKIKNGDQTARDKMIESNLRLVVHVAKNYTTNATQDLMDLIQEGILIKELNFLHMRLIGLNKLLVKRLMIIHVLLDYQIMLLIQFLVLIRK